jgi:hypothetical protein
VILEEWFKSRAINQLVRFANNRVNATGKYFNFILSNGTWSTQRDKKHRQTNYTFIIPADAIKKIRSVTINHDRYCIRSFSFFDKDGALLWEIGWVGLGLKKETVVMEENELIAGVIAKLSAYFKSVYTDF